MIRDFIQIFERDLAKLEQEINSFQDEQKLWMVQGQIKNSAGNLCLHLVGNLKTYIGKNIGNNSYNRNRDAEFSTKNISKQSLIDQVQQTRKIVATSLAKLSDADLDMTYVEEVLGHPMTTRYFLLHLASHLAYHLGQINYLRRMIEPENATQGEQ